MDGNSKVSWIHMVFFMHYDHANDRQCDSTDWRLICSLSFNVEADVWEFNYAISSIKEIHYDGIWRIGWIMFGFLVILLLFHSWLRIRCGGCLCDLFCFLFVLLKPMWRCGWQIQAQNKALIFFFFKFKDLILKSNQEELKVISSQFWRSRLFWEVNEHEIYFSLIKNIFLFIFR